MKKLIVRGATCPCCGSEKVIYSDHDFCDDIMSYKCECDDCHTTWNEDYLLSFCGISKVYDKDGNQLGNVISLSGVEQCPE